MPNIMTRFPKAKDPMALFRRNEYVEAADVILLNQRTFRDNPAAALALASDSLHANFRRDFLLRHCDGTIMDEHGEILAVHPDRPDGTLYHHGVRGPLKPGLPEEVQKILKLDDTARGFTHFSDLEQSHDFVTLHPGKNGRYNVRRYFMGGVHHIPLLLVGSHHYDLDRPGYAVTVSQMRSDYHLVAHTGKQALPCLTAHIADNGEDNTCTGLLEADTIGVFIQNKDGRFAEPHKALSVAASRISLSFWEEMRQSGLEACAVAHATKIIDRLEL